MLLPCSLTGVCGDRCWGRGLWVVQHYSPGDKVSAERDEERCVMLSSSRGKVNSPIKC